MSNADENRDEQAESGQYKSYTRSLSVTAKRDKETDLLKTWISRGKAGDGGRWEVGSKVEDRRLDLGKIYIAPFWVCLLSKQNEQKKGFNVVYLFDISVIMYALRPQSFRSARWEQSHRVQLLLLIINY